MHSFAYEKDTGCKNFLEDVFENEERIPGGNWNPSSVNWTDIVSGQAQVYRIYEFLYRTFYLLLNDTRTNLRQFCFPSPSSHHQLTSLVLFFWTFSLSPRGSLFSKFNVALARSKQNAFGFQNTLHASIAS